MAGIIIIERPDYISFDEIHEFLWMVNEQNRKDGFVLRTSQMDGDSLQESLGENGVCLVALDGRKLVGTLAVASVERNRWCYKGRVADFSLIGVHPDYHGRHILHRLFDKGNDYVREKGYSVIELETADKNGRAINAYKHFGYSLVGYKAIRGADHHSVVMAKWINNCPYSSTRMWFEYHIRKIKVNILYKPGRKKRLF